MSQHQCSYRVHTRSASVAGLPYLLTIAALAFLPGIATAQQSVGERYMLQTFNYTASGEMIRGGADEYNLFDTQAECSAFVDSRIKAVLNDSRLRRVGSTVLVGTDGSGWLWIGCVHPSDVRTQEFADYFDTRMTKERAKTMPRFPKILTPGPSR